MMPVSELVRVARTLRDDWSSPVAEAAAATYGLTRTQFVRSSASHVFFAGTGESLDQVLRLHPAGDGYAAEVVPRVPGEPVEPEDLSEDQVRRWGALLADFHRGQVRGDLPDWYADRLLPAVDLLDLPRLRDVARRLADLPRTAATWGRTHGDPEPDNVVWSDPETPVLVDLDDEASSWFGADVCFALRDLGPDHPLTPAFLTGYGDGRDLLGDAWPEFRLAHDGITAARLVPVVDETVDPGWPDWASRLHTRVSAMQAAMLARLS